MRNRSAVGVAALVLLLTGNASAQDQATRWRDSASQFVRAAQALRDTLVQRDSSTEFVARRGDLSVAASPVQRGAALAALDSFARVRDHWFGAGLPSAGGFRIVLHAKAPQQVFRGHTVQEGGAIVLTGGLDTDSSTRRAAVAAPEDAASELIDQYTALMINGAPNDVAQWLEIQRLFNTREALHRDVTMYTVVTGTGKAQRDCVAGDNAACRVALGLVVSDDRQAGALYRGYVRADLLRFALQGGGAGAWQRFAAHARVADGLAAAAQVPLDSLLAHWRSDLLTLRPASAPLTLDTVVLSVLWTTIIGAAALGAARWS